MPCLHEKTESNYLRILIKNNRMAYHRLVTVCHSAFYSFMKANQVAEYESMKNLFPREFSTYSPLTTYVPRSSLRRGSDEMGSTQTDSEWRISFLESGLEFGMLASANIGAQASKFKSV